MIERFSTSRSGETPSIDQLEEYYELMRDTLHSIGRGVRVSSTYPGKERLLPGFLDEFSGDSESMRQRSYAATMRRLGETGAVLAVAENDHILLPPNPQGGGDGAIAPSAPCINLAGIRGLVRTRVEPVYLTSVARRALTLKCCHDVLMAMIYWR